MALLESPTPQPTLCLTPLIIALSIIVSAVLILVALHFLLKRLRNRVHPAANLQTVLRASPGVDKKVLDSILVQAYNKDYYYQQECSVCLSVLEEGERVRVLPNCCHVFHVRCIDVWLVSHLSCPVCRSENFEVDAEVNENFDLDGERTEKFRLKRCQSLDDSFNV